MKKLLLLLFLLPELTLAQSSVDGTWIIQPDPSQLPQKPVEFVLANEVFRCSGGILSMELKADGPDHKKIKDSSYWDAASVRVVDTHTVEIVMKKSGKATFTEIDTVSTDGATLTQLLKDTTEAQTVTTKTLYRRDESGPTGSSAISGSWRGHKMNRSKNGSIIRYRCAADGFSAETPLGEKFDAKFDGQFYPLVDVPGHTLVSVKRMSANEVEVTSKRDGKIVGMLHLTAAFDGKSIHAVFENKENGNTATYEMLRRR